MCGFFPSSFSRGQLLLDGKRLNVPESGSADMVVFHPESLTPGKHVVTWDVDNFDHPVQPLTATLETRGNRTSRVSRAWRGGFDTVILGLDFNPRITGAIVEGKKLRSRLVLPGVTPPPRFFAAFSGASRKCAAFRLPFRITPLARTTVGRRSALLSVGRLYFSFFHRRDRLTASATHRPGGVSAHLQDSVIN